MPTYLEYIGALSPRKGVGPSLRYPGYMAERSPGAFNRGSQTPDMGALGALNAGGGDIDADADSASGDDDTDTLTRDDFVDVLVEMGLIEDPDKTDGGTNTVDTGSTDTGGTIDTTDTTGGTVDTGEVVEPGTNTGGTGNVSGSTDTDGYGDADSDADNTDNSGTVSGSIDTEWGTTTSTTTSGTGTDTTSTTTSGTDDGGVLSTTDNQGKTPAELARENEDLARPGGSTKDQPTSSDFGVLNQGKSGDSETAELSPEVEQALMDLGVMDAAGQWKTPEVTMDVGLDGTPQILINGKTVSKTVLDAIRNQFPDIIANAPPSTMPAGDTHLNVGGKEGIGETGIGVAVSVDPTKDGLAGENILYKDVTVDDVEELRRNPFWWLNKRARQLGTSAREVWLDVKDKLGLSEDEKAVIEASGSEQTSGGFAGFTDPGSVSDYYKDATLEMDDRPFYATGGKSPLSAWDIPAGRGLPYDKFPVDGGQSEVLGEILIDQMAPDPNTLRSEIDRMVASSLPFVSVTGDDGQQYMYDKQTGQTYSLPDYAALVEKRNTIGLPPSGPRMPGRLPSYGRYGYG